MPEERAAGSEVNKRPFREAMGLPPGLHRRAEMAPLAANPDLQCLPPRALVAVAEEPTESFARRYAAALLLGMLGDPRVNTLDPAMVEISGGTFRQGLDVDAVDEVHECWAHAGVQRAWILKECPSHLVSIRSFLIAKYPVTNSEYLRFVEDEASSELPTSWRFGIYPAWRSNHPVWTITPQAAEAYVAWLRRKTGRKFRLPREAEWEYAAGGPASLEYPWGMSFESFRANTVEGGPLQSTPVGIYPDGASPFGVLDMAGNVEEYVAELYTPYPGGEFVADDLAKAGPYRMTRGGSFTRYGDLARCRRRHGWFNGDLYPVGFRLAEDV